MKLISRFSMGGVFTFSLLGFAALANAEAVTIPIDMTIPPAITSQVPDVPFQELNGTQLTGQTLPLDFTFSNGEFVRLFTITSFSFEALISLQTNSSNAPGFRGGTGYLIDGQGMAIPGFGITGSAAGNGFLGIALFPLWKDSNGTPNTDLARPLDFYGIHYDLMFPNAQDPSIQVTMGTFSLFSDTGAPFGIGPGVPRDIVPDQGSGTLVLLSIGLLGPILARLRLTQVG
jgi:hypothetical protein